MIRFKNKIIIGIDHGYGNIKTCNHIFKTGVLKSETEPVFQTNMLIYGGRYYLIYDPYFDICPDCGEKIALFNDGGNGFCTNCAHKH